VSVIEYDAPPNVPKKSRLAPAESMGSVRGSQQSIKTESGKSMKEALAEAREMTDVLIQRYLATEIKPALENIRPIYGVSLKDLNEKPVIADELTGGKYESNPELSRKMSKLSYVKSFKNGLQPGYLEKVESVREAKTKMLLDSSSLEIGLDSRIVDSTLGQSQRLDALNQSSIQNLSGYHRRTKTKLDSVRAINITSKMQLFDEDQLQSLRSPAASNKGSKVSLLDPKARFQANSVLLPSIGKQDMSYAASRSSLKEAYKRVNPHEDGIITGGINRVLQYQKGNPYTTLNSPTNQKLEVVREYDAASQHHGSTRSQSMVAGAKMAAKPHPLRPSDEVLGKPSLAHPLEIRTQKDRFNQVLIQSKKRARIAVSLRHSLTRSTLL
jgi:hypothetical protein